jgi:ribosomal protein S6
LKIKEAEERCHEMLDKEYFLTEEHMGISERTKERRKRMVANRADGFKAAEDWDLDFWQSQTPQQRLSALVAIRKDVLKVMNARTAQDKSSKESS